MKLICRLLRGVYVFSIKTATNMGLEFQCDLNFYGMLERGVKTKSIWLDSKGRLYRVREYYEKPNRG